MDSTYIQALQECRADLDEAKAKVKHLESAIKALAILTGATTRQTAQNRGPRTRPSLRARVEEAMAASPEKRWDLDDLMEHLHKESPETVVNAGQLRTAASRVVDSGNAVRGTDGRYEFVSAQ